MPSVKTSREDILHRCWQVIHLHGYQASSVSMLAKAAGLGKAGLLHHFGSKEGLMHAVVSYAAQAFRDYVFAVAREDLPPEQRLEKMLRRQNRLAKLDQRGCFFTNLIMETGQSGRFNEQLQTFYEEWQATLVSLLTERLDAALAKEQAYLLLVEYQGSVALYKLSGDEQHLEKYVRRAVQLLSVPSS
ncbi:MAG: TetR/AcrR family transcriptional regulator [Bacteroidetes bacterium]|nr:MAG: TetR/AcrR family transcriptional regulator [Bacteroidota bacterium]